jgi:ER-bound oxygenase mpaB/B'/Rubber oxygenase, catalytic domain
MCRTWANVVGLRSPRTAWADMRNEDWARSFHNHGVLYPEPAVELRLRVMPMPMEIVTATDLEQQLAELRGFARGEREGVFGPASVIWRIDREAAIFLGAGRALLLQLAHPWVAAAIFEHSRTFTDPIGRFHRTFEVVFSLISGRCLRLLLQHGGYTVATRLSKDTYRQPLGHLLLVLLPS